MDFEILLTKRNGECLWHDFYRFKRTKKVGEKKYWRCHNCRSTCVTENDIFTKPPSRHDESCISDETKMKIEKMEHEMRRRATTEPTAMRRIYDQVTTSAADDPNLEEIAAKLPRYESMQTSLYRARKKTLPNLPRTLADLELPEAYTVTTNGERFLLYDSGPAAGPARVLVFATDAALELLSRQRKIWVDGTFKSAPNIFYQVISLQCLVGERNRFMVPIMYALVPNKQQATYERVFDVIRDSMAERQLQLQITRFCCDFEEALRNTLSNRFPGCRLEGCFFHFCQCLFRKVQGLGLQRAYAQNRNDPAGNIFRQYVKCHGGLALIPFEEVEDCLVLIRQGRPDLPADDDAKLRNFDEYFTTQWIERMPPRTWNHYENEGPRTNNYLEGYHQKLNSEFNRSHPCIFRLVNVLKQHDASFRLKIAQLNVGNEGVKKNTKYVEMDRRIASLRQQHRDGQKTTFELCRAASHYTNIF